MIRFTHAIVGALAIAALTTACSSEDLTEQMVENTVESELGVDIEDDDSITVETDDGSVSIGTSGDLPESFPSSFDVADAMIVVFSGESTDDISASASAILEGARPAADVVAYYRDLAVADGFTINREMESDTDVAANLSMGDTQLDIIGTNFGDGRTSVSITFETPNS